MSIIICDPVKKVRIFVYNSYIHVDLGKLGGVILLALCAKIIVHPSTIHMKHCSSRYYYPTKTIHSTTIIENTDIVHNIPTIHTGTMHYSYRRQLLPIF